MRLVLSALAAVLVLAACAEDPAPEPVAEPASPPPAASGPERAVAEVGEVAGSGASGTVRFTALDGAVEVRYDLAGLTPGEHGFHVHQTGDCGPDSTGTPAGAAGGHFNPLTSPHGAPSAVRTDRHAGDLGNIEVGPDGRAVGTRVDSVLAFTGPTSMIGKAVMVHAGRDDLESQPSGAAGDRVACGVIVSGATE